MAIKIKKKKRKDKPGRDRKPVGSIVQHFTGTTRAMFIQALSFMGNVSYAAKLAGFTRQAVYQERRRNQTFATEWESALQIAADGLEQEAWRRAMQGVAKPVYQKGKKVGTIQEYSDRILIVLLRAARPNKFNDRLVHGVDDSIKELQQERLVVEKALNDPELLKHLRAVDERVKYIECTVSDPKETVIEPRSV